MSEEAITSEGIQIEIAGEQYTMRRLGMRDVFRVVRILGNGVAALGASKEPPTAGQVLQVLVHSMTVNENEVLDLIADLLNVDRAELNNPDKFPMESIVDIFKTLSEHQDLRAFLDKVARLTETLPEMQTASREASSS